MVSSTTRVVGVPVTERRWLLTVELSDEEFERLKAYADVEFEDDFDPERSQKNEKLEGMASALVMHALESLKKGNN